MKKYWKNAKKNWKSQGNSSVQKSGNHEIRLHEVALQGLDWTCESPLIRH